MTDLSEMMGKGTTNLKKKKWGRANPFKTWEVKMELKKIIAIIRSRVLEDVEEKLKEIGVRGLTVTRVKGYGENKSIWAQDWLV